MSQNAFFEFFLTSQAFGYILCFLILYFLWDFCVYKYVSLFLPMFLVLLLWTFLLFVCFVLCYLGVFYFNLGIIFR